MDVPGLINTALARYVQFGDGCPRRLAQAIQHSLLAQGKRLRPQLVLLATQACGGSIEMAVPAACAVEMVHAYSLIHDDLPAMDDDDMRRGQPSCHVAFGEATAILAGDALLARAFEVLAAEGYLYSSSIYPIRHDHYGMPAAPRFPFFPEGGDGLLEIPVTTTRLFGQNLPCGGGGYFRLLPFTRLYA